VSWSRIAALALRILTQFRRDRRTLVMLFVVPIVVLGLLGYLLDLGPSTVTIGVVNEDTAVISAADRVVADLEESGAFEVVELSRDDVDGQLREGEIQGALIFPADFTQRLATGLESSASLILEGSDSKTVGYIRANLARIMTQGISEMLGVDSSFFNIQTSFVYGGPQYSSLDYLAPALLVLMPFFFVFLLTSVSFLRERTQGTMERLLASPLSRADTVVGYMLGFGVFALLESIVILLFTVYVLQIHHTGSIFVVILTVVIMALTAVNLGIFLSTFARNEFQAVQFMPLIVFPQALLGGLFWSIDTLPWGLRWLSYLMPLTYANYAVENVMIKGASIPDWSVASNLLILLAFAAVFIFLSSRTLRSEVA